MHDNMTPAYAAISSISAGLVAQLAISLIFVPIAIGSPGTLWAKALTFLRELGRRMSVETGDMRETALPFSTFIRYRLMLKQRFI